ncbi:MAG: tRNA (adenosine(37)-N6)-threonylcarbamoyltransferase complex ATPase subunit type 1 TsaE [Thermodesulfobacteriota bacterium]
MKTNGPAFARYLCKSPDETRALARALGARLGPGRVVALSGELGAGKTCFCQGLALGLGVSPSVAVVSPTYTMVNAYPGRVAFLHADLYRVSPGFDPSDLELDEAAEQGVLAVEWAERADPESLGATVLIQLFINEDETRTIAFTGYGQGAADLINGLDRCGGPPQDKA